MTRQSLVNGDVYSAALANAAGNPRLDGRDEYGSGPKVIDDWLDDAANQIKGRFYGWYDRVQVSLDTGLSVTYTGAVVMLADGSQVSLSPGALTLPANTTSFIFITDTGVVSYATSLPAMGIPLAKAITDSSSVVTLEDLRSQVNEQVRPIVFNQNSGLQIGDIKESARLTPEVGWVRCNHGLYQEADYPLAFQAIGRTFSKPSDPPGTFRVPPLSGRVSIGGGTSNDGLTERTVGEVGGSETVRLTNATLPRHTHNTDESPHSHSTNGGVHSHDTRAEPHYHNVYVSDETSDGRVDSIAREAAAFAGETNGGKGYFRRNAAGVQMVSNAVADVDVRPASANVTVQSTTTGLSVRQAGEGQPHPNMQPFCVLNKFIRLF